LGAAFEDRALGAFLGLAVGDALGTTLEFAERDGQPLHTEMLGGGVFNLGPGEWTDDTSLALALAESLADNGAFVPADVMRRFLEWRETGAYSPSGSSFDIGMTTAKALGRYRRTGDPFSGSTDSSTAGNGSVMRLAPAVIFAAAQGADPSLIAREQSRLTHGATDAVESCELLARWLSAALATGDKATALKSQKWQGSSHAVARVAAGSFRRMVRNDVRSTGYSVDTIEAAAWSVWTTTTFEEAVVAAVNLAGDADTIGAVAGQIAGAAYGLSAIPDRWLLRLAWRDRLAWVCRRLFGRTPSKDGTS
jgi:ADP-ribosyl-[dinitrogen reductase] hydrolase